MIIVKGQAYHDLNALPDDALLQKEDQYFYGNPDQEPIYGLFTVRTGWVDALWNVGDLKRHYRNDYSFLVCRPGPLPPKVYEPKVKALPLP